MKKAFLFLFIINVTSIAYPYDCYDDGDDEMYDYIASWRKDRIRREKQDCERHNKWAREACKRENKERKQEFLERIAHEGASLLDVQFSSMKSKMAGATDLDIFTNAIDDQTLALSSYLKKLSTEIQLEHDFRNFRNRFKAFYENCRNSQSEPTPVQAEIIELLINARAELTTADKEQLRPLPNDQDLETLYNMIANSTFDSMLPQPEVPKYKIPKTDFVFWGNPGE